MRDLGIEEYKTLYLQSIRDPEWFWSTFEKYYKLEWFDPYSTVLDTSLGIQWAKWFVDGKFNIAYNCLDRNIRTKNLGSKLAYICESEDGSYSSITYDVLNSRVNKFSNALRELAIKKGDVVSIYMSNTLSSIVTMLACAKVGAIHNVIFSGLGPTALMRRLQDSEAKVVVTSNGYRRRGKIVCPASELDLALREYNSTIQVILDSNIKDLTVEMHYPSTLDFEDLMKKQPNTFQAEETSSEDSLFILHTSGTTGSPKGVVHVHAGFAVVSYEQTVHSLDMKPDDILFWSTDIGWISAHIWVVYGLLLSGGTGVLYDGAFDYPGPERNFEIIKKHGVSIFGTSPTAVRLLRRLMSESIKSFDFSKIKSIALTGEPIDRSSWLWLYQTIGHNSARIFNNSGGTEVGGAILGVSPLSPTKPASLGTPQLGFAADVYDEDARHVEGVTGYLVVTKPWPSRTRGLWRDSERYIQTYWTKFPGIWHHGDWAKIDENGYWFILGRVDDVIKVAGHRIGSGEVEDTLLMHPSVAEAAVVGKEDPVKGQKIVAYLVLKEGYIAGHELFSELAEYVARQMGGIARPSEFKSVSTLPKTATGKILRNQLKSQP